MLLLLGATIGVSAASFYAYENHIGAKREGAVAHLRDRRRALSQIIPPDQQAPMNAEQVARRERVDLACERLEEILSAKVPADLEIAFDDYQAAPLTLSLPKLRRVLGHAPIRTLLDDWYSGAPIRDARLTHMVTIFPLASLLAADARVKAADGDLGASSSAAKQCLTLVNDELARNRRTGLRSGVVVLKLAAELMEEMQPGTLSEADGARLRAAIDETAQLAPQRGVPMLDSIGSIYDRSLSTRSRNPLTDVEYLRRNCEPVLECEAWFDAVVSAVTSGDRSPEAFEDLKATPEGLSDMARVRTLSVLAALEMDEQLHAAIEDIRACLDRLLGDSR